MAGPSAHPDSTFSQLRSQRRGSWGQEPVPAAADVPLTQPPTYQQAQQRHGVPQTSYYPPTNNITPGADNFSRAAAGGMAGIAHDVAERNPRASGVEAMSSPNYPQQAYQYQQTSPTQTGDRNLRPAPVAYAGALGDRNSSSSMQQLNSAAVPMAQSSPGYGHYTDDPYQGYSVHSTQNLGYVDPNNIYDDGDDGLEYGRNQQGRKSMLSLGGSSSRSRDQAAAAAGGGAAGAAGLMGAIGGLAATRPGHDGSGQYNAVQNANTSYQGPGASTYELGNGVEKSAWLEKQSSGSKKLKWLIIGAVGAVIVAAIVLGAYFGVVKKHSSSSTGESAQEDTDTNGDLDINSSEIQKLLNNKNLHKVFPGIDYTPINTQYPDCLHNPPSQNNVTRDLAVLSQLTNTIRLYGTDCNQTEMLVTAVDRLQMNGTIKIWMGVWQDNNATTNARQLAQMWDIVDKYGADPFKGIIVANEILFREQMTITELGDLLSEVRTNLTAKGISLPIATSDLGDDWTSALAAQSDYVMSNIHPFFAGVSASEAAAWTWSFWDSHNAGLQTDLSKNIIAETGWPSQGGTDCGSDTVTTCTDGSVAGIDEMNQFMSDWVCQALTNGTQYFWFESFDEPWKIMYNTGDENWEDHWGLMDVNRNLKDGVTIPDCDGQTVGAA
ncbi:hypothetical protein N0V93_008904 [Gnomoniopsis smithogilvyi]|uniref:glucan endo-1,3-beta-D-glucosidase n=1 Tax=Gnomoniopsis smithogilvyi TaxID=1191159 RepID=A0A9W8YKY9_9PEZI|nr:hypothetical protein N0V93_008904 [Gnomoniopsis smithogilvyi]